MRVSRRAPGLSEQRSLRSAAERENVPDGIEEEVRLAKGFEEMVRQAEKYSLMPAIDAKKKRADADTYRRLAAMYRRFAASDRQEAAKAAARADFHAALRRKYEQAAAERWFTVEPDPPEPP